MLFPVVLAAVTVATVLGQDEFASDCPAPNGFFADAFQCDKYYECVDNVIKEKTCSDGFAFNDLNPKVEKCDFLYQVDCTTRPDLQPALGNPDCPRANGYFPHPDADKCNVFSYCSQGTASTITCPQDLVFSPKTGTCTWPDQSGRADCDSKAVLNFTCPAENAAISSAHPRYADPNDCQYFFVCISGITPRHNGCKFGEVFNGELKACDSPSAVLECEKYYYDYFDEYFATLGAGSTRASTEVIAAALASNYPVPENAKISLTKPRINSKNRSRKPTKVSAPVVAAAPRRPVTTAAPRRTIAPRRTVAPATTEGPAVAAPRPTARPKPNRRRIPGTRRRKTTTTTTSTTTEAPAPEYYYDYDYGTDDASYYEDYPGAETAPVAPTSKTPSFRSIRV